MRPLASAVLALSLISAARAADIAAPAAPKGPVPISAPVLSALSLQLGELSKMQTSSPEMIALRLSKLAQPAGPAAGAASSAASAILIKQALTDSRALKTLFDSLQEAGDRGAAASHSLADLRESIYAGSTPEKVRAAMQWTLGPLEQRLSAGRALSFESLASFYDASNVTPGAEPVRADVAAPGQDGKIRLSLQPASPRQTPEEPHPGPARDRRRLNGVILENEDEASPAVLQALDDALLRIGALPSGVTMTVRNGRVWGDNPQILIDVGGRTVYHQYLYHAQADLGSARLGINPVSWFGWLASRGSPSPDLSRRFEAALRLARKAGYR